MATSEEYINQLYDKQKQNTLAGLQAAYNQNVQTINDAEAQIKPQYYEAKRQASGDANIRRQNLNETLAANGLNTGAAGQAQLALANQANANIAAINRDEANAKNAITQQRTSLETAYRDNVQQAIAAQDYERANALYNEWQANRKEAKAQVDKFLAAGIMPSADMISQSGYSNEYVNKLYAAMGGGYRYTGGGGNTETTGNNNTSVDDGAYAQNAEFIRQSVVASLGSGTTAAEARAAIDDQVANGYINQQWATKLKAKLGIGR